MMIFKRGVAEDKAIIEIKHKGDKISFTHIGTLDEAMQDAYVNRLYSDNGFTDKRNFRKVAVIPDWVFVVHPEFNQDPDLALDWVKRNGDGIGDRFKACTGRF
ncbi:MAG: hypothetical protein Q8O68_00925 [Candidatus Daviesbacteria bacterium]|nr:hypothetical protein [Candidatus Daviesbacteria bacterium]